MGDYDYCKGSTYEKEKARKPCSNRKSEGSHEGGQNGLGKSVFGRLFKDFRSGQSREPKPQRPLGRTLSANFKDKERKTKLSRTLSASQKDRKIVERRTGVEESQDWEAKAFHVRNYKSFNGDGLTNGYPDDSWLTDAKSRKTSLSNPSPESCRTNNVNDSEINHSALVSYLDEEGLKKTTKQQKKHGGISADRKIRRHVSDDRDGTIMPTSSLRKKSTGTNHYENHNSFLLNELNKGKNSDNNRKLSESDYSQINYSAYQTKETGKTSFNYYNDHRYENLDTTDYISWSCVKDDTFDYQLEEDVVVVVGEEEDNDTTRKVGEKVSDNTGECGFRVGLVGGDWCRDQDVPDAPTRDPVSLKSIKYGPGHEKYPSWPGSVRPDTSDKPQRSHSWTEKTTYPKEKVTSYARPYTKRTNASFTQQLKTVMERCEKITPESYQKTMEQVEEREKRIYLPRLDREGNSLGDQDYMVPSPPERDKPSLTQADLEKYYRENHLTKLDNEDYSTPYDDIRKPPPLTQADLEEYSRSYDDVLKPLHQHQGSYAQSEGYHSYVSSSELTTTPFLDRLRRDSDSGIRSQQWSEEDNRAGRDSVVTTSSGSASSSETLKWHGSMSDVSVSSNSCRSRQLIAHSSRVPPPQRHYSESVLYLGNQSGSNWQSKGDRSQQLKLFPVNTYTVQPNEPSKPVISPTSVPKMSVAERISELERQQQTQRFAYYDPDKRHKVSDPTLKAIQKKALLSFYERHQHTTSGMTPNGVPMQSRLADAGWKTEQKLTSPVGQVVSTEASRRISAPPLPPPRSMTSRRASCASDMSLSSWSKANHSYSCSLVGPAIIGPSISVDDWVPELPPKKPHLRSIPPPLPQRSPSPIQVPPTDSEIDSLHSPKSLPSFNRMPTPDLPPPPPPPPTVEEEVVSFDEPLPPPPPEVEWHLATAVPIRSTPMSSGRASPQSPVRYSPVKDCSDVESTRVVDQNENIRSHYMPDAYEIQYDQNAINAIMESNRLAELQKKKHSSKGKHSSSKDFDEKSPLKVHIENRPPLPLPRDVHHTSERKQDGCDRDTWQSCKENQPDVKVPFMRSISKPENSTRTSVKLGKNDVRSSLRHSSKKPGMLNGKQKGRISPDTCGLPNKSPAKTKSVIEFAKPVAVKKVSEYECRVPIRDRDGLTVFEGPVIEDPKQTTDKSEDVQTYKGSNSKAAFLALRREKEMGMTNCEGSYKLTVSQSGERIDTSNGEKFPLEMMKLKEKSTENLVLDNRLTLEPPDLIPKISNLNRKSSSAQDIRDNRLKYEYNHFNNNDKYRLKPVSGNNGNGRLGMFSDNILQSKCKVTFSVGNEEKPKSNYEIERIPVATVECVRAVITKLEAEAPERLEQRKENVYQSNEEEFVEKKSTTATMTAAAAAAAAAAVLPKMEENDKYGVSISLSRTETDNAGKEKTPTLLRVRSNIEKRLSRSDSMKSNDGKVDRSKSLKLVERSTSFDRSDTMKVVGFVRRPEERNLNLSVSDASSQTDLLEEDPARDETDRKKLEEELECERLSRDLASQLPPSDKLHSLLVPESDRKKPTDYVAGLFHLELPSKRRRQLTNSLKLTSTSSQPEEVTVNGVTPVNRNEIVNGHSSPSFFTSIDIVGNTSSGKGSENSDKDTRQLQKKKEELMARLDKKLTVLKEEQEALTKESTANEELGNVVAKIVAQSTRPHDLAKYRLHVEEISKITSLLLGLSGRLAKAENALLGLPSHHDDRKIHECKRDKLQEQLEEAKQLKENIDKRSESVAKTLGKHLNPEEYADYVHFIRMKAKLIVDLREIGDKISLGEEQLAALKETLSS